MRKLMTILGLALPLFCLGQESNIEVAAQVEEQASQVSLPSIAAIQSVEFLGKQFILRARDDQGPDKFYEYFLADESPSLWLEMVEFHAYQNRPVANDPLDFVKGLVQVLKQNYPSVRSKTRKGSGSDVFLEFLLPSSTRDLKGQKYHELNFFRYAKDATSRQVICTHYAKNMLLGSNGKVSKQDLKQLEAEVRQAFETLGNYQP